MLSNTSTEWAPWYVIPADDKPFARVAAGAVLAHTLMQIDPQYPTVTPEAHDALRSAKVALEAEAPKGAAPDPNEADGDHGEPKGKKGKGHRKGNKS